MSEITNDFVTPFTIYSVLPDGTLPPSPDSLAEVWPMVSSLLSHQRTMLQDEHALQAQQRGMISDGCFLMASPYPDQTQDLCTRSWFHEYQFYYEFCSGQRQRYFWITGMLDRGYLLDTIWFPYHGVAVTNFPPSIDAAQLDRFCRTLVGTVSKPAWSMPPVALPRVAVIGFQHLMHMMWNQLPALDRLTDMVLPQSFSILVQCEPFGPTASLFPELASVMRPVRYEDMLAENARNSMVLGLGSWTITIGTQDRVRRVAAAEAQAGAAVERNMFKANHHPVFWLSVKPPKRTISRQIETLVAVIESLRGDFPNAGFILDGASLPWDYPTNGNYPPWFHSVAKRAVRGSAAIINAILVEIDPALRNDIMPLNDVSACDEVVWGEAADFYICHGGTMQNKIGWIHRIPGFIHSNSTFLRSNKLMTAPLINGPLCFYASSSIIVDDDAAGYSALELARKDQNYDFISVDAFIGEIRTAISHAGLT